MNRRDEFLNLLELQVKGMRELLGVVEEMPDGFWKQQPEGYFGPGEVFVHIIQSGAFAKRFIREQLGLDPPTELEPFFQRAAFNHEELSKLNLRGARKVCGEFSTYADLRQWVPEQLNQMERALYEIPGEKYNEHVSHPLVHMQGEAGMILHRMYTVHIPYHLAQLTQQIKAAGFRERVPFLPTFGRFEEVPVEG